MEYDTFLFQITRSSHCRLIFTFCESSMAVSWQMKDIFAYAKSYALSLISQNLTQLPRNLFNSSANSSVTVSHAGKGCGATCRAKSRSQ